MNALFPELVKYIRSFLPFKDDVSFSTTCSYYRKIGFGREERQEIWEKLIQLRNFWDRNHNKDYFEMNGLGLSLFLSSVNKGNHLAVESPFEINKLKASLFVNLMNNRIHLIEPFIEISNKKIFFDGVDWSQRILDEPVILTLNALLVYGNIYIDQGQYTSYFDEILDNLKSYSEVSPQVMEKHPEKLVHVLIHDSEISDELLDNLSENESFFWNHLLPRSIEVNKNTKRMMEALYRRGFEEEGPTADFPQDKWKELILKFIEHDAFWFF